METDPETMSKVRVLLADDHEATLGWTRSVLDGEFEVVGTVRNGRDAVTEVCRLDPDVLVLDISMPILDGLHAASLLGADCRTKIVFLTLYRENGFVDAAFSAGASAFVVKSDLNTDLVPAIREALEGRRYISKSIRPCGEHPQPEKG
jgi:DNA-binding NarL/FixJ family response regulator